MTTVALEPKGLSLWNSNLKELSRWQPRLAAALENWTTVHGHALEHDELVTPAGTWVSGLSPEPFFQPTEIPERPWRKEEEKRVPIFFIYGIGAASWLVRLLHAVPRATLGIVVLEPHIELLAYLLHTTNIYAAVPEGCRLSFVLEPQEAVVEEALMVNVMPLGTYIASLARIWVHPGEAEIFQAPMRQLQQALR